MTAPKPRRTLSRLLIGSLLLCAVPQTASSQQNADDDKRVEQVVQTCFDAPARQALQACELLALAWSQRPEILAEYRSVINARWSDVLVELGRDGEAETPARIALMAAQENKKLSTIAVQQNQLARVLRRLGKYVLPPPKADRRYAVITTRLGA